MAVRHSVYTKHRLVFSVADGYLTAADIHNHVQSLIADPDFEPRFDHLSDFTAVTDWNIRPGQMYGLARVSLFSETSRRALIAADDHIYGMLRMYLGYRSDGTAHTRIFPNREEALSWLGLPPDIQLEIEP